jgi:hypothetical protein
MYQHCIKKIVKAALQKVGHSPESAIQIMQNHRDNNKSTSSASLHCFYNLKNLKDIQQVIYCSTAQGFRHHPVSKGYCQAVSWLLKDFIFDVTDISDTEHRHHSKYPSRHNVKVGDCVRKMLNLEIWKKINKVIYVMVLVPAHSICRKHIFDNSNPQSSIVQKLRGIDCAQFSSGDIHYNTALLRRIQDSFIRHANKWFSPGSREWVCFNILEVFLCSYAESNLFKSVKVPGSVLAASKEEGNLVSSKYVYCILNHNTSNNRIDCGARRKKRNWLVGWAIFKYFSEHFLLIYCLQQL